MLVILMENQLISPNHVCSTCLLADQSGQPRWSSGRLRCGRALQKHDDQQMEQFECQMGFRVANVE
ncbi:MAG: hypothetical protein NW220_18615 [Leptolyngbyaceae cyanobacterium bins.349]|nr:hypothetical protein [Leptolyngbyaceae cyanobacterium bins.349]